MSDPSLTLRDGCLLIDETGEVIHPALTAWAFEQLQLVKDAKYHEGTHTATVNLGLKHIFGQAFTIAFVFQKSRLCSAELSLHFDDPAKDKPWDYEIELERKKAHETWCQRMLGRPLEPMKGFEQWERQAEIQHLLTFPWGSLRSIYDSKGGFSYLALRYEEPAKDASATT
ncbi:MAG: hypothetical protein WD768_11300 [Phycisphaeraceae bacterium]